MDFWRGLCLLDMLLVHLIYQARMVFGPVLGPLCGEYGRFAAGGFVFLAGMGVGRFFLPKANNPATRSEAYLRLWRRAVILLCAHYVGTFFHILFDQWLGYAAVTASPLTVVRDVLLLRQGDDLLPFYVVLTTLTPLLLMLLRRRDGFFWVGGISLLMFWVGSTHPNLTPLFPNFPPLLWQMIFIAGLLSGAAFKQYDALSWRVRAAIMCVAWVMFGLLFYSDYAADFGWPPLNLGVIFYKRPLSLGETLRYLSITVGLLTSIDLAWPVVSRIPGNSLIATLGRRSLVVYVSHLFLISLMAWVCDYLLYSIGTWQIILVLPAAAMLWGVAAFSEWVGPATFAVGRRLIIADAPSS
jgi:hypothetical protein